MTPPSVRLHERFEQNFAIIEHFDLQPLWIYRYRYGGAVSGVGCIYIKLIKPTDVWKSWGK